MTIPAIEQASESIRKFYLAAYDAWLLIKRGTATSSLREKYAERLCDTLEEWRFLATLR